MSIEGVWTVEFLKSEEEHGGIKVEEQMARGGIFVLTGKRMYGGGLSYYFVGTYKMTDVNIEITVNATRYNDILPGLFGPADQSRLIFNGNVKGQSMILHGHVEDDPNKKLMLRAQQRTGLI